MSHMTYCRETRDKKTPWEKGLRGLSFYGADCMYIYCTYQACRQFCICEAHSKDPLKLTSHSLSLEWLKVPGSPRKKFSKGTVKNEFLRRRKITDECTYYSRFIPTAILDFWTELRQIDLINTAMASFSACLPFFSSLSHCLLVSLIFGFWGHCLVCCRVRFVQFRINCLHLRLLSQHKRTTYSYISLVVYF